jgi:GR25 family glycosyltransferase involved in LPS biosynthesis
MEQRFYSLDISCNFYDGIDSIEDERTKHLTFNASCMYGHLDMINQFYYNTSKPYGIFCEDDILIHKNFKEYLFKVIPFFNELKLDVLLIGCLIPCPIYINSLEFFEIPTKNTNSEEFPFKFYSYCDELWGTQMYMLSREYAKNILDKYYDGYKDGLSFSADYTITKDGNRGMLYPLLVIEDGKKIYDNSSQKEYHYNSFSINYIENIHI